MAFVRRKGNSFYLVHNVRRGEKVQQLHLARLGQRARITDEVVKEVSKKHPFVELNWRALREQCNHSADLADRNSPAVQNSYLLCGPSISNWRMFFRRSSEFQNRPWWLGSC